MFESLRKIPRTYPDTATAGIARPAAHGLARPSRSQFRASRWGAVSALAALATSMTVLVSGPALAAVFEPPPMPQEIIVFPERDFTVLSGFAADADMLVELVKPNGAVTRAEGRTDSTGFLEVNHPGGVCWLGTTPDIKPADLVRVTYRDTGNNQFLMPAPLAGWGSATTTQNVTATQAVRITQGTFPNFTYTVVIKGQAQDNGNPIPLDRLEVRIIQPDFIGALGSRITRRDIRADSTGGRVAGPSGATGTLAYDGTATTFTAIFSGLNADESLLAIEGQTRAMAWQKTASNGDRLGMTIYEVGELGGPGFSNCPAGPNGVVLPKNPTTPVFYDPKNLLDASISTDQPSLKDVTVFPQRDFISIAGFDAGTELQVVVRRGTSLTPVIGTARGFVGKNGMFEVNHPGGVCWTGQTPDVKPGDWIDVFKVVSDQFQFGQTQRVIDTTVLKPAYVNNGLVKVEGIALTAPNASGTRQAYPLRLTEQRIINPDFRNTRIEPDTRIGRRDMRADINGGRVGTSGVGIGQLTARGGGKWEAVYSGLNLTEQRLAVAGQTRAMAWLSTNATGDRFGMTIFEYGELGGPGIGGCPATGTASIPIAP